MKFCYTKIIDFCSSSTEKVLYVQDMYVLKGTEPCLARVNNGQKQKRSCCLMDSRQSGSQYNIAKYNKLSHQRLNFIS